MVTENAPWSEPLHSELSIRVNLGTEHLYVDVYKNGPEAENPIDAAVIFITEYVPTRRMRRILHTECV